MRARAAFLIAAGLLAGCSRREHLNPFDPDNPDTRGRPSGFVALAGANQVVLRWNAASAPELVGYELFRSDTSGTFIPISGQLDPSTTRFLDFGLPNDQTFTYRLYFVFARGRGGDPAVDLATPGLVVPWVTDLATDRLVRLTADGRRVASSVAVGVGPAGIAVDAIDHRVWVCNSAEGTVTRFDVQTSIALDVPGFSSPLGIAVDLVDHSAWVADDGGGAVSRVFVTAGPPPLLIPNLDHPLGVAVDPVSRSAWVAENGGNRVRRIATDGTPEWAATVIAPSRVAVDSATGIGWVTSFSRGQVVKVSGTGVVLDTLPGFDGPVGIAVDPRRGRIWVADPNGDQVVALRRDGTVEFRIAPLTTPREIAVDLASGEAWATLSNAGEVVRLSPTGTVLVRVGGLASPYGVALDRAVR